MPHAPNTAVHVTLRTWPKVVRQQPKVVYRGILGAEKVRPLPEGFRAQDHLELEGDFGWSLKLAL